MRRQRTWTPTSDPMRKRAETATEPATPPEERIAALEAELAESQDRLLRALAETENTRRRAQREREDADEIRYRRLRRGPPVGRRQSAPRARQPARGRGQDERTRSLLAGVAATERELLAAFERHGIEAHRPDRASASTTISIRRCSRSRAPAEPAGTIVQVLQPGYVMHDRLLRPAMVGVAKAPGDKQAEPL